MAVLTEEQSMLRDAAKSWVQEKSPVTAFRKMRDSGADLGYDTAAWNEMDEMGWAGVIVPEEYGGSNFGYLSLGLVLEELGRHAFQHEGLLAREFAAADRGGHLGRVVVRALVDRQRGHGGAVGDLR